MTDQKSTYTTEAAPKAAYRKVPRKQKLVLRVPMTEELLATITEVADSEDRTPEKEAMRVLRDHFIK